ncbi:MAG: hypothetical protein IH851_11335 [Armatimonadetes bacterium]|nr:hypothetical protein [Armatimonadota bacterium]
MADCIVWFHVTPPFGKTVTADRVQVIASYLQEQGGDSSLCGRLVEAEHVAGWADSDLLELEDALVKAARKNSVDVPEAVVEGGFPPPYSSGRHVPYKEIGFLAHRCESVVAAVLEDAYAVCERVELLAKELQRVSYNRVWPDVGVASGGVKPGSAVAVNLLAQFAARPSAEASGAEAKRLKRLITLRGERRHRDHLYTYVEIDTRTVNDPALVLYTTATNLQEMKRPGHQRLTSRVLWKSLATIDNFLEWFCDESVRQIHACS